jgi:hypothetical protein
MGKWQKNKGSKWKGMLSGRGWLCEFASKVTKNDYKTDGTYISLKLHYQKIAEYSYIVYI